NRNTIDSCFISERWHVKTISQYARTPVGISFLVVALEGLWRLSHTHDAYILGKYKKHLDKEAIISIIHMSGKQSRPFKLPFFQQMIQSLFYFVQFSITYLLMLAAMSHNGGHILAIFASCVYEYPKPSTHTQIHREV
ncbi:Ctr copper transporter, partial [Mycena sp. CBHHK59/15]